jgi:polyphosphate glucokinase
MSTKNTTTGHLIGIDIGGTGIKGGIVNLTEGKLYGACLRLDTPKPATPDAVTDVVARIADELAARNESPESASPRG